MTVIHFQTETIFSRKNMKIIYFILLFLTFGRYSEDKLHPVHFSVVNMEYNDKTEAFDISIKLFTDDFEKIVDKNYNVVLNLGKENQLKDCNRFIDKYIKKNFLVIFDKKAVTKKSELQKITVNENDKATWIYYSLKSKKPRKVLIRNTLMNDLYTDQKNLFIFTVKDFQEAKKFEKSDTDLQFVVK